MWKVHVIFKQEITMKICKDCKIEKPLDSFSKNGTTPKGSVKRKPNCKPCEAQMITKRFYKIVEDYLGEWKCCKCGYNKYIGALELHHVDPSKKEAQPSKIMSRSEKRIIEEISKCIIVCSNCHREIHAGLV